MTKRTTWMPLAGRCRRWSTALMVAMLAGGEPGACAQSELRFVESQSGVANSVSPSSGNAKSFGQAGSEFKLLDLSEAKTPPLPQFSLTRPGEATLPPTTPPSTSLKFATAPQGSTAMESASPTAVELRFVEAPESTRPERIVIKPLAGPLDAAIAMPLAIQPSYQDAPAELEASPTATELFATLPQTRPSELKPRIVSSLEHVPAPVPQHVTAQPVRGARESTPGYTPPGSELFVSVAPQNSVGPQKWDVPALDYGAALQKVEPAPAVAAAPRSIEPTQIVARELPTTATEMFTFAKSEPIITGPPVATLPAAKAAAVTPEPIALAVVPAPVEEIKPLFVSTPPKATSVPPSAVEVAPAHVVSRELPPAATGMFSLGAPEPIVVPVQKPEPVITVSQPVAAPVQVAATKPQFESAPAVAERIASATPIVTPSDAQRLVPASIAEPTVSQMPLAYEAEKLANAPASAAKPEFTAPAVTMPERSQVTVSQEPSDPNVYKFHFASATDRTPAQLVNTMRPTPAASAPPVVEVGPEAVPAPYDGGYYGQYGCPYLPGQSGTRALCGVDCGRCGAACNSTWGDAQCIPWALFGPGEYVGPARPAHVDTYFLRVNDNITLTFIQSRKKTAEHYRIGVGDELQIEWLQGAANTEVPLDRKLLVQPDGTVTLPLIGDVVAAGKTINDFRDEVVKLYSKYQREPQITVTPLTVNVAVQDVLKAVTAKNQSSGQTQDVKVTPEGTIQAAGIGSVYVQGLSLDELRSELEARYSQAYGPGLNVSPQLTERATSYVFMGGEVKAPGRYILEGPTTASQAIAMAGGWNNGGNLRQIVIFRRDENWCLKATKIDLRAAYYGKDPCPMNDVWLRDNDLVIVPKSCILCATDLIELYFTRGVYAVFPINYVYDFSSNSGIIPVGP